MLVYGMEGRNLLDLLYAGWTETDHQHLNLCEYASKLADTLNCVREIAADKSSESQQDRKILYDRKSSNRILETGSLVMCRIPGLKSSLTESWSGPF